MRSNVAPAFVHVDLDDLWAIAECYGITVPPAQRHLVLLDALPRLRALFAEAAVSATLFVVGRDLESDEVVAELLRCIEAGHQIANHSHTHRLDFRTLTAEQLREEVRRAGELIEQRLGVKAVGFRAPGYGYSTQLLEVLSQTGYTFDSSLMPGPYGAVFRYMDARMQKRAGGAAGSKTQYSRLSESLLPLHPHRRSGLVELPVATSPLLRLPFQAGVSLRLGKRYSDTQLRAFAARPRLPLLFLMHAADIADFSGVEHPFFRQPGYFSQPADEKQQMLSYFLERITATRHVTTTEAWLAGPTAAAFIRGS